MINNSKLVCTKNILKIRNVKFDKTRQRNWHIHWDPANYIS